MAHSFRRDCPAGVFDSFCCVFTFFAIAIGETHRASNKVCRGALFAQSGRPIELGARCCGTDKALSIGQRPDRVAHTC